METLQVRCRSALLVPCFFFSSRRRHTRFKCDWSSDVCSSDLLARDLCAAGKPDALLSVTQPIPHVATARGYVEKYGPEDRYDLLKYVNRLGCQIGRASCRERV